GDRCAGCRLVELHRRAAEGGPIERLQNGSGAGEVARPDRRMRCDRPGQRPEVAGHADRGLNSRPRFRIAPGRQVTPCFSPEAIRLVLRVGDLRSTLASTFEPWPGIAAGNRLEDGAIRVVL